MWKARSSISKRLPAAAQGTSRRAAAWTAMNTGDQSGTNGAVSVYGETKFLWETLLTSQQLQTTQNNWLNHFESLGSHSLVPSLSSGQDKNKELEFLGSADFHDESVSLAASLSTASERQAVSEEEEENQLQVVEEVRISDNKPDLSKAENFLRQNISPGVRTATSRPPSSTASEYLWEAATSSSKGRLGFPVASAEESASSSVSAGAFTSSLSALRRVPTSDEQEAQYLQSNMEKALQRRRNEVAYEYFNEAIDKGLLMKLQPSVVRDLFRSLYRHPIRMYRVLKAYQQMTEDDYGRDLSAYTDLYRSVCDSTEFLDPALHLHLDRNDMIGQLVKDVRQLDHAGQELCFPVLLSSLVAQRFQSLGKLSRKLYDYVVDQKFQVPPGFWEHLLAHSKYRRQSDLPYDQILLKAVEAGRRPNRSIVMNAIQNTYPFTDGAATATQHMLQGLSVLMETSSNAKKEYPMDIAILEAISMAAAQKGNFQTCALVWDILSAVSMEASEGIYESTIVAFCGRPSTYKQAFFFLDEMMAKGHQASRAFIRSMSAQIRLSPRNQDLALDAFEELALEGKAVSVPALNVVMSASAERGDIEFTMSILNDIFRRYDLQPDSDTFSYAMESIGKHLMRKTRNGSFDGVVTADVLEIADTVLSSMESSSVLPNHHFIRAYVELLCQAQETETATTVVKEFINSEEKNLLNSKILYCVAIANARQGNFDTAHELLDSSEESVPFAYEAVRRIKRKLSQGKQV